VQSFLDDGAKRAAVLDVDYHHGNGTQSIFYARNDVLTRSLGRSLPGRPPAAGARSRRSPPPSAAPPAPRRRSRSRDRAAAGCRAARSSPGSPGAPRPAPRGRRGGR
jgi:hypothetical protein